MSARQTDEVLRRNDRRNAIILQLVGLFVIASIALQVVAYGQLVSVATLATRNRANGDLLVDCVTPGSTVPTRDAPDTGHECWDRLHNPHQSDAPVTTIRCFDLVLNGYRPNECNDVAAYIDTLAKVAADTEVPPSG